MRRQGQFADSSVNATVAAQKQNILGQRMQPISGMNNFVGQPGSLHGDEERQYMQSKSEGQWQWDRDGTRGSNSLPPHTYKEGSNASRSLYQGQRSDSKLGVEKQANTDLGAQAHKQEMEIGYEDNTLPQTFEGLEKKFFDDIVKLTKEQQDAEDAENARHRERLSEINAQYQEKLLAVRAHQAARRDEFLHKEAQTRHQQYQQAHVNNYESVVNDAHAFGPAGTAGVAFGEGHRPSAGGQYDSYREQPQFPGGARGHGFESRGPYPGGRAYGANARYY